MSCIQQQQQQQHMTIIIEARWYNLFCGIDCKEKLDLKSRDASIVLPRTIIEFLLKLKRFKKKLDMIDI